MTSAPGRPTGGYRLAARVGFDKALELDWDPAELDAITLALAQRLELEHLG